MTTTIVVHHVTWLVLFTRAALPGQLSHVTRRSFAFLAVPMRRELSAKSCYVGTERRSTVACLPRWRAATSWHGGYPAVQDGWRRHDAVAVLAVHRVPT